mmetsp:Transcript_10909/g.16631  ORF Transcript_10909/g.16631 Transcript_10909/m.16631 type:complete len:162 (-) Transcript_10909:130-615(-)
MIRTLLYSIIVGSALSVKCPASDSMVHAGCEMEVQFDNSCSDVQNEILARINGQYSSWHDPHNNGTYTLQSQTDQQFEMSRLTGDEKYTDKIIFTFEDSGSGCSVGACSESQVFSIGDFSTNYCNMHDLYCSDEGCHPFNKLAYSESVGKCTSHDDVCLTV